MFHTRGSDHLEILTHITPYHNTCLLNQKHPFFFGPKSQRVHRDLLTQLGQLKLQTYKSRVKSVVMCWDIFFLDHECINLMAPSMPLLQDLRKAWPDITNFRRTTNWCDSYRTIHHSVEFQCNLHQQGNCTMNRAHCQRNLEVVRY